MGEYNIGQFIYRSRKAVGLTQDELCRNVNGTICCSVETLSRIERGKQRPNYRTMRDIMRRLGKENCFCAPYLKTTDYRVLELNRELKRILTLNDYNKAEQLLGQLEKELSLQYVTNRQYLIRVHATIDERQGRITAREELEMLERALKMTVHSYGTESFSYEILLPEEIVTVCNIADSYGRIGEIEKALSLLQTVTDMLNDVTLQINYPTGIFEMVNRNRIKWIGERGLYREAIEECDRAIEDCLAKHILNTLPSLYYARAYNMQKLRDIYRKDSKARNEMVDLDYIKCALLAELVQDEKGRDKALSKLV